MYPMAYAAGESVETADSHGSSEALSESVVDRSIAAVVELRDIARLDDGVRQLVGGSA